MTKRLYLIDGHAQIYRAHYAPFRELNAPSGEPTKATHVFWQMMLTLAREKRPDYLAVTFDVSDKTTFRTSIFPEYKANREAPPEDLSLQMERIMGMLETAGVPILRLEGFEADDIMATAAERLAGEDLDVYMVSKDKDLEQLVGDHVFMYDPAKDQVIDAETLRESKGYGPEQAVEVQTLMGDCTDNIPGVVGVGPKKAAQLIGKYLSAQAVLDHADELTPKLRENVLAFAEQIERTRQLVTLRRDVPVDMDVDAWRLRADRWSAVVPVFEELGFRRLTEQLASLTGDEATPAARIEETKGPTRYELVDSPAKLEAFTRKLAKQRSFAFDTETTGLNPVASDTVGMSFSWKAGEAYYLPVRTAVGKALDVGQVREAVGPILADPAIRKCGHNVKYDLVVLRSAGFEVGGVDFDSMIASFLLEPTRRSHGMDYLAGTLLGHQTIPITDLIGRGKDQLTLDQVDVRQVCEYACEDADVTWRLREELEPGIEAAGQTAELFHLTEMPLVEVLAEMELNGVALDTEFLARMSNSLADRLVDLTRQVHRAARREFNIDSTRQLGEVLFDDLGLPVIKRTKTGRSTDAETLETLALETDNRVPRLVLEYRELTKLKSTYLDALPERICERTGRVHASFHQTGAITGRLSSSDPNLQNIPIRTELGREIRRAFVAGRADHVLITADYSQIELRVLAHFSKDPALMRAFEEDQDIHRFVAAQVFGVDLEDVTPEQRGRAKAVNFGIIYGQTPYGLSRGTGMAVSEAKLFIDTYFMRYPGIRLFMDGVIEQARREGLVRTMLGRVRPIEGLNSRNKQTVAAAERLAVNTVIQGSAADLIKRAMIGVHRRIHEGGRASRMIIQVHDELVFEAPAKAVESEQLMIREEMEKALPLAVPIRVDLGSGINWLESK
ncbi:MAG: DNA polymerase I [Phycisphaerales bacterium]|nr:MAG: DNA polymerase I [Phycisphaerales bacterium]